jgi:transposase InsO family protein
MRQAKVAISSDKVLRLVQRERQELHEVGGKKLYYMLKKELQRLDLKIGRDKFLNLLRDNGLLKRRKKYRKPVTDSKHPFRKHKNLIKDLPIERSDQVWVSDITYVRVSGKWNYLTLVTDVYSRKLVGYSFSAGMSVAETTGAAMKMAFRGRDKTRQTILHSDRGIQYCNPNFVKRMNKQGIVTSMGERGNPYENAIAERMNGILKYEFGLRYEFREFGVAKAEVSKAVKLYNNKRPHWSLNLQTPNEVYQKENKEVYLSH